MSYSYARPQQDHLLDLYIHDSLYTLAVVSRPSPVITIMAIAIHLGLKGFVFASHSQDSERGNLEKQESFSGMIGTKLDLKIRMSIEETTSSISVHNT